MLASFFLERKDCDVFDSSRSAWVSGVPQDPVLGLLIYPAGIGALLEFCELLHQLHADDVLAYTYCTSD